MTRRKTLLFTATLLVALLAPSVCSAGARLYAVWQPNGSATWVKANAGATVGNVFRIRCVMQPDPPDLFMSVGNGTGTMTENGPHASTPFAMSAFTQVPPNAAWGDPTSNVVVLQSTVSFPNLHNAPYTFNITCGGDVLTMMGRIYRIWNPTMQLNIQNLAIASCSPSNLLVWNGTQGTNLQVAVTLSDDDLLDPMNLSLSIFSTKADNRTTWPSVRTINLSGVTGANHTFTWDGKNDAGQYVEPWTYTFTVTASHSNFAQDVNSYRSGYLSLIRASDSLGGAVSDAEYDGIDDNGTPTDTSDDKFRYFVRCYVLKDVGNPAVNATEGVIKLYDPDLASVAEWNVTTLPCRKHGDATDGLTASSAGTEHELLIKVPIGLVNRAGDYIFVASMKDGHANDYRTHEHRWTRELNNYARYPGMALWASDKSNYNVVNVAENTESIIKELKDSTGKKHSGYLPWGPGGYPDIGGSGLMVTSNTPVDEMIRTLYWLAPWDDPTNNEYRSKNAIFAYFGHATMHTLSPDGKSNNNCLADDYRMDQNSKQIGMFAVNPSTGQPYFPDLDYLRLVFLYGCYTAGTNANDTGSSIAARFYLKGAKSVVGFNGPIFGLSYTARSFNEDFWYATCKLGYTVKRALKFATDCREIPGWEQVTGIRTPVSVYWGGSVKLVPARYGSELP